MMHIIRKLTRRRKIKLDETFARFKAGMEKIHQDL
jgi:hypothetical protein